MTQSRKIKAARFDGLRALITGSAQGIGYATAARLVSEGAEVIVADQDEEAAQRAVESLAARGGRATSVYIDVRDQQSVSEAFSQSGELDVIVANAGVQNFVSIDELTGQDWDRTLEVNARGVFYTIRHGAQVLSDDSAVVAVASIQGYLPNTLSIDYAASKAAIHSLVRSFAKDLAPRGIRVNAVSPGRINTPLTETASREIGRITNRDPSDVAENRLANNPFKRAGKPHEVAAAVAFLASSDASYITGTSIDVCGGDVMR